MQCIFVWQIIFLSGGIFLLVVPVGQIKKLQESYQQNLIR
jgi:hypothetical protein